ncbi:hypothetical protein PRIPAC_75735 [Pristionchus pacificus]|uniref:G protein-coupled receptor n=1 Tax=Pristionchus pacificus TaxID=54126 RepID=A0A2A6C536_PRIPA|nr:hypothetical protein PRIPAC_75735 [Pristionchus pacificus]|eukprot:PDM73332.1 G protein-coupled receptor [Pristionchus pacificus]
MHNSSAGGAAVAAAHAAAVKTASGTAFNVNVIAYAYVLPCICMFGIVGNITNLVVLASRRLRAVSYMYLRALAVADLLCMMFVLVFVICDIAEKKWQSDITDSTIFRVYRVHFMLTLINWALGTGTFIVVALSLERFVSIVFPMHFRQWNSPNRAAKAILISYIVPLFLYIPYGYTRYTGVERFDNVTNTTRWSAIDDEISKSAGWNVYKWCREVALRFAPIVILSLLNVKIMMAFRKRQNMFKKLTKKKEHTNTKDDTLIYMLAGTSVMFFICNIPAALNLLFIDEVRKRSFDYQIFRAVANILEITNHASQFYVFCACSSDYRTTFLLKFPCFKKAYSRGTLRTIVKRTQSIITRDRPTTSDELINATGQKAGGAGGPPLPGQVRVKDTDTVDVALASCEEMEQRSDERESEQALLRHQIITSPHASGTSTFL